MYQMAISDADYAAVHADEYELPIAQGETIKELANQLGVPVSTIKSSLYLGKNGKNTGIKYIRIPRLNDDEEEELYGT